MNTIKITKEFNFEMAHALDHHAGPCKNLHGHSYQLAVTVKGKINQKHTSSDEGMVIDFSVIKQIVTDEIIRNFDHATVLEQNSHYAKDLSGEKIILLPFQPTCENLLLHFAQLLKKHFNHEISLNKLMLRETATSYAEWYHHDNHHE